MVCLPGCATPTELYKARCYALYAHTQDDKIYVETSCNTSCMMCMDIMHNARMRCASNPSESADDEVSRSSGVCCGAAPRIRIASKRRRAMRRRNVMTPNNA